MTWSYRVLRTSDEAGEAVYRIYEVYYGDDGSIDGWTVDPVEPLGESLSELREDIRYFLAAFRKPVLEEAEEDGKPVLRPADAARDYAMGRATQHVSTSPVLTVSEGMRSRALAVESSSRTSDPGGCMLSRFPTISIPLITWWIVAATVAALMLVALPASAHERETDRMAGALAADLTASDVEIAAVVDFTDLQGNVTELGRFLAEELSIALASQAERLRVIDRTHLKVLLEEHKLSSSGLIDPQTARELGRIAGVGALITGTVSPLGESVRLTIKALDTETAQIVTSTASNIERTQAISDLLRRGITAGGGSGEAGAGESIAPEETAEAGGFHFRLKRCEVSSQKLVCRFLVTNQKEDRRFHFYPSSQVIIPSGNQYESSLQVYGSDSGNYLSKSAPRGIPVKAAVVFPGVPTDVRRLALLEIDCRYFTVQFRNVPVYSK